MYSVDFEVGSVVLLSGVLFGVGVVYGVCGRGVVWGGACGVLVARGGEPCGGAGSVFDGGEVLWLPLV